MLCQPRCAFPEVAQHHHSWELRSLAPASHNTLGRRFNYTPTTCQSLNAATAAAALTVGFLPWTGCSQGGFYATGVVGSHGTGCQAIYQPAAAAEQRFAAGLKQGAAESARDQGDKSAAEQSTDGASPSLSTSSTSSDGSSNGNEVLATAGSEQEQQATASEQLQQVPAAAKDLIRDILQTEQRQRTKQLVDDAWQTLE